MRLGWIAAQRWRRLLDTPNSLLPSQRSSGAKSLISGPATYQGQGLNIRRCGDAGMGRCGTANDLGKLTHPEVVSFRIPSSPHPLVPALQVTGTDGSIQNTSQ